MDENKILPWLTANFRNYVIPSVVPLLTFSGGCIQQQLRNVAGEISIRHLRLRNVFSDDLFVYYDDTGQSSGIQLAIY